MVRHSPYVLTSFPMPDRVSDADLAVLTPAELERVDAQRTPRGRARAARSRAALRRVLAPRLGVAPGAVPIRVEAAGRPVVDGGPAFSVSRGEDRVVIVVADQPGIGIGVDIVPSVPGWPARDIVPFVLSHAERRALHGTSGHEADRLLLRMWSLKEARLKGTGVGFQIEPAECRTWLLDDTTAVVTAPDGAGPWAADTFSLGPDALVSVAWRNAET